MTSAGNERLMPDSAMSAYAEDFLPSFDVSDTVAVTVEADPERAWEALMGVDLLELGRKAPIVGILGTLRALPGIVAGVLQGERPPSTRFAHAARPAFDPDEGGRLDPARRTRGNRPRTRREVLAAGDRVRRPQRAGRVPGGSTSRGLAKTIYDLSLQANSTST